AKADAAHRRAPHPLAHPEHLRALRPDGVSGRARLPRRSDQGLLPRVLRAQRGPDDSPGLGGTDGACGVAARLDGSPDRYGVADSDGWKNAPPPKLAGRREDVRDELRRRGRRYRYPAVDRLPSIPREA